MSALAIASIVFARVFGSAMLGLFLRAVLPKHHLSDESKRVVELVTGLIATMRLLHRERTCGAAGLLLRTFDQVRLC
jgi:hypothetical protein